MSGKSGLKQPLTTDVESGEQEFPTDANAAT